MAQPALAERLYTPEELEAMPDSAGYELIDGVLTERQSSVASSMVGVSTGIRIGNWNEKYQFGHCLSAGLGLQLWPERPLLYRRASWAFIRHERIHAGIRNDLYLRAAPDLVVEVVSPFARSWEISEKVAQFIEGGVRMVWIIQVTVCSVQVVRSDGPDDELSGEDVLPWFKVRVQDLYPASIRSIQDRLRDRQPHGPDC